MTPQKRSENRASEVLSGKRNLPVKMLIALHKHLNIPTDTLLGVGTGQTH
jgi:antitoxin component HigA of HigAB toxin-antitoxin module